MSSARLKKLRRALRARRPGGGEHRMEDPAPDVYAASYEPVDDGFEGSPDYESGYR